MQDDTATCAICRAETLNPELVCETCSTMCGECGEPMVDHSDDQWRECSASATYDPEEDSYDASRERAAGGELR